MPPPTPKTARPDAQPLPPPPAARTANRAGIVIPFRRTYTTGQLARYMNVAPRTVAKWIDAGQLTGNRMPLSQDRRVTHPSLVEFIGRHFPGYAVAGAGAAVVLVTRDESLAGRVVAVADRYGQDVSVAATAEEAAAAAGEGTKFLVVDLAAVSTDDAASIKATAPKALLAVTTADDDALGERARRLRPEFLFGRGVPQEGLTRFFSSWRTR